MDEQGFLYFIGRRDEMIKSSGYRISPNEVEEVLYGTAMVGECAAFGVPHPTLSESVVVIATAADGVDVQSERLLALCRERLPAYMVPRKFYFMESFPITPNGKADRRKLAELLK